MTKHTPATPLPWTAGSASGFANRGEGLLRGNGREVADFHYAGEPSMQDAAYIAHAANAYPRLVDALKTARAILNARGGPSARERDIATMKADALLRELGEDE